MALARVELATGFRVLRVSDVFVHEFAFSDLVTPFVFNPDAPLCVGSCRRVVSQ